MTIYLVRHGETEWNVLRRLQGQSDSPLTERGLLQVHAYAVLLREVLGNTQAEICMSPLPRTRRTAAVIAEQLRIDTERCEASDLLRERYCGAWEGLGFEQVEQLHGAAASRRAWTDWNERIGGDGETLAEMHTRALDWLAQPRAPANTVVVTHGIMSRIFRGAYLSLEPDAIIALPSHPQDRIFRLHDGVVSEMVLPEPL